MPDTTTTTTPQAPGTPEELELMLAQGEAEEAAKTPKRIGDFEVSDRGVFWLKEDDEGKIERKRLCDRLDILASTRNESGEAWGSLLGWSDGDGRPHKWAMPRAMLAGDGAAILEALYDGGLSGIPQDRPRRFKLLEYLAHQSAVRYWCEARIGWHPNGGFILPGVTIGGGAEPVIFQPRGAFHHAFNVAGSLTDWKEQVARYAVGNSRLAFCLAAAFAGPLLEPTGEESGGFHIFNTSSKGKTTTVRASASVWGGGRSGYLQRWKATSNAIEWVAEGHHDGWLCLDEIGQANPKEIGEVVYALGNGQGKLRGARQGGNRPTTHWRVLYLSSGEKTLEEHMRESGQRIKAGQEVRLVNVPFPDDWEELHGFPNGDAFARHLNDAASRNYGSPIRAFLETLSQEREGIRAAFVAYRQRFNEVAELPADAPGEVSRVAGRFALVAFGGELATKAGTLPWPKLEAERAAVACFRAWLETRDTRGASDMERGVQQVRLFLASNGASRFEPLRLEEDSLPRRVIDRAGFTRKGDDGGTEYLVLADVFRDEVCQGFNAQRIAKELHTRGFLIPGQDKRMADRVRHPEMGRPQVYVIRASIFGEEEAA